MKVYEERTGRKEIILDVDLSWRSDCDVSVGFRGLGLPPVLVVREVFVRGTARWVSSILTKPSLQSQGSCIPFRIKLRPLIKDIPFFSNLVVSFVAPPEINFDLGGVANLLDFPGLVEVAKSAAMESLSTMVVLPCGIVVPMVELESDIEQVDGIINVMHALS